MTRQKQQARELSTKKIGEVCDFISGLWKGKKSPYVEVGVLRNTNFTKEGKLDYSDVAYIKVEKKQFENRKLAYGDIILEKSGGGPKQPVGRVAFFDKLEGDFSLSNFTTALRIKDIETLDFEYLYKFLYFSYVSGVTEKMQSHSTGIRNLDLKLFKGIEIPIPPLPEQKRIVKLLDEIFEKIAKAKENTEKNLKNSRELFESYLQSVFASPAEDWEEKKLGDILDIQNGYAFKSKDYVADGIRVIRIGNVQNGTIVDKRPKFLSKKVSEKFQTFMLEVGDILVSLTGDVGRVGKIESVLLPAILNQRVGRFVHINEEINKDFLYLFLNSKNFERRVIASAFGTAQKNVSTKQIKEIVLMFPKEPAEQKRIVTKLDSLSAETKKLEVIYKQKLADLDELKKSVLKKAFSGEL